MCVEVGGSFFVELLHCLGAPQALALGAYSC